MSVSDAEALSLFETFVRNNHRDLLRFATALFRRSNGKADTDRAEEAVQEAFTIAWEKRDAFLASPNPTGWMYLTLKNVSSNMLRQDYQWTMRILQAQQSKEDPIAPPPGQNLELEGIIPQEDLNLLKRIYLYGETYEEVALSLGIKKSTLAMRVHRIKDTFRQNYEEIEKISSGESEQTTPEEHVTSRGGLKQ